MNSAALQDAALRWRVDRHRPLNDILCTCRSFRWWTTRFSRHNAGQRSSQTNSGLRSHSCLSVASHTVLLFMLETRLDVTPWSLGFNLSENSEKSRNQKIHHPRFSLYTTPIGSYQCSFIVFLSYWHSSALQYTCYFCVCVGNCPTPLSLETTCVITTRSYERQWMYVNVCYDT